jgi:hypothetical protein
MKVVQITFHDWTITVNVRLSAESNPKWTAVYEAERVGHLPLRGQALALFDDPDRALDRALGDAIRRIADYAGLAR